MMIAGRRGFGGEAWADLGRGYLAFNSNMIPPIFRNLLQNTLMPTERWKMPVDGSPMAILAGKTSESFVAGNRLGVSVCSTTIRTPKLRRLLNGPPTLRT